MRGLGFAKGSLGDKQGALDAFEDVLCSSLQGDPWPVSYMMFWAPGTPQKATPPTVSNYLARSANALLSLEEVLTKFTLAFMWKLMQISSMACSSYESFFIYSSSEQNYTKAKHQQPRHQCPPWKGFGTVNVIPL
eukprot:6101346-Amphidinium_carterae.1